MDSFNVYGYGGCTRRPETEKTERHSRLSNYKTIDKNKNRRITGIHRSNMRK